MAAMGRWSEAVVPSEALRLASHMQLLFISHGTELGYDENLFVSRREMVKEFLWAIVPVMHREGEAVEFPEYVIRLAG